MPEKKNIRKFFCFSIFFKFQLINIIRNEEIKVMVAALWKLKRYSAILEKAKIEKIIPKINGDINSSSLNLENVE